MLRTSSVRILSERDREAVCAILDTDPVGNVFVASRLMSTGITTRVHGAEVWGHVEQGRLTSLCYAGANLVPVNAGPTAIRGFADHARRRGRRCSSIVGPVPAVSDFWSQISPAWGPARAIRASQPVLEIDGPPAVPTDPLVRRVRPSEISILLPACVDMFTEEVGVPPDDGGGGALYRARVEELVRTGRAFARIEDGRVVFKAEIGAVSRHACQIQGVWVHPDLRGQGFSTPGMAAVVSYALAEIAPRVTLYVNDFNTPARATYRKVGFRQVGEVMSVLF